MSQYSSLDLVIRFSSLGDLVLCSAFVNKLSQQSLRNQETSNIPILFVTDQQFVPLLSRFPGELETVGLSKQQYSIAGAFFNGVTVALKTSASYPNLKKVRIYDLHNVFKSMLFSWGLSLGFCLKGIKTKIFRTAKKTLLRTLSIVRGRDLLGPRYVYVDHQNLIPSIDRLGAPHKPQLHVVKQPVTPSIKILLAPDAKHWKKRWPVYHWESLFDKLLSLPKDVQFTVVGGSEALNEDLMEKIVQQSLGRVQNKLGHIPLENLPDIAHEHSFCITGNSAWMHISEAVGRPVISLAGPIVPGFGFSPWNKSSIELHVPLSCRPCTKHGGGPCYRKADLFHACMKQITPERVFQEVKKLLLNHPDIEK